MSRNFYCGFKIICNLKSLYLQHKDILDKFYKMYKTKKDRHLIKYDIMKKNKY